MIRQSAAGNGLHLSWRPPKFTNGHINGYVIQYTTDRRAHDRDWMVEAVVGDGTKATIRNLLPSTKYYFKMSARNNKGNISFQNSPFDMYLKLYRGRGLFNQGLLIYKVCFYPLCMHLFYYHPWRSD